MLFWVLPFNVSSCTCLLLDSGVLSAILPLGFFKYVQL
jgi:hypothetical protein